MANATNLTEDGKQYVVGKQYWFVNTAVISVSHTKARCWAPHKAWFSPKLSSMSNHFKIFNSIVEANKFIIKNKPDNVPYYDED